MPTHEQFLQTSRFGSLDGLRGISILLVILSHTVFATEPVLVQMNLGVGMAGVRLFFALSGFLITTLLLREGSATGTINLTNFVVRRSLRIFPLYYAVLILYALLTYITDRHQEVGQQFFRNLPYFISYTNNWFVSGTPADGADRVLFAFAWSLATEEQFYLIWPSIEKFLGKLKAGLFMIFFAAAVIAFRLGAFDSFTPSSGVGHAVLHSISPAICLGVLIAHLLHSPTGYQLAAKVWTPVNGLLGLLAYLAFIYFSNDLPSGLLDVLSSLTCVFIVLSCVQSESHILTSVLRWRLLSTMGMVSYGMYLLHLLCNHTIHLIADKLHLPEHGATAWLLLCITLVSTLVLALISFRTFEAFFLKWKTKFEPKRTA